MVRSDCADDMPGLFRVQPFQITIDSDGTPLTGLYRINHGTVQLGNITAGEYYGVVRLTKSINLSADGAVFLLKQPPKMGTLLELSLPLPKNMQKGVSPKPVYEAVGLVTRIEHAREVDTFRVAVRFRAANTRHYRAES